MKALKIDKDGLKTILKFERDNCYDVLSDNVGGLIECVSLHDKIGQPDMWLNEDGKSIGLEQNPTATALWADMYDLTDVIMGDVVITGAPDEEGNTTGLTQEQIDYFLSYDRQIWNTAAPGFISFS